VLRDPWLWLLTLLGAGAGAMLGTWFGPTIGEPALAGAVALGITGLIPGLFAGLVVAWIRRRSRAVRAQDAARERFIESLNEDSQPGSRLSIDRDDRRVLITDFTRATDRALDAEQVARLRRSIEQRSDEFAAGAAAAAAELKRHGFQKWVFRINGETILERALT
jgi:hypothetical protein